MYYFSQFYRRIVPFGSIYLEFSADFLLSIDSINYQNLEDLGLLFLRLSAVDQLLSVSKITSDVSFAPLSILSAFVFRTIESLFRRQPAFLGAMGCGQRIFKLVWRCYQPLSGFLTKDHLPWVSRQSRRSLMIRVIMKSSRGLCTDLPEFPLRLRKTPARRTSDDGTVQPSQGLKWYISLFPSFSLPDGDVSNGWVKDILHIVSIFRLDEN